MARLRSLTARPNLGRNVGMAALVAVLLLPAGLGCTGTSLKKTKSEFAQALRLDKPAPASEMICFWQRRPQHLPDPTRDGIMSPGLVGQMFLISSDNKAVEISGDLVVQALDETPRQKGQPSAVPEIWHIDKVALKKLRTNDDRFGPCYAIFLPWPQSWKDVTNVRMQAKYISDPNPNVFAKDVQMTLEFGGAEAGVWNNKGTAIPGAKPTSPSEMRGIPDLAKALKNPASYSGSPAFAAAPNSTPAPAGVFLPPQSPGPPGQPGQYTTAGPDGSTLTTKTWTSPPPTITPPPVQQTTFDKPLPIHAPTFQQLPAALSTTAENNAPPINIPNGPLQPVVIPRQ